MAIFTANTRLFVSAYGISAGKSPMRLSNNTGLHLINDTACARGEVFREDASSQTKTGIICHA